MPRTAKLACAAGAAWGAAHAAPTASLTERPVDARIVWRDGAESSTRGVAVCITDRVRDTATLRTAKAHLLDALNGDLFVYSSAVDNEAISMFTWHDDAGKGAPRKSPEITGLLHVPEDELDAEGFHADLQPYSDRYMQYGGSVAPLPCDRTKKDWESQPECGHVLSIYVGQLRCQHMVEAAEQKRGKEYDWVLWTRGELQWMVDHPPLDLLSPSRVWIPQCSSDFGGLYDRHAAIPRKLSAKYLSRYSMLKSGEMLTALEAVPALQTPEALADRYSHNSEALLRTTLNAMGVSVGRFPCVAALSCCQTCFSDGCCTAEFTNAAGERTELQVKSYGEHQPSGAGPGAEDDQIWNFSLPMTSLEGAWAVSQAQCAADGGQWHLAQACSEGSGAMLAVGNALLPALDGQDAYVSVCPESCARPPTLQCTERSSYKEFQRKDPLFRRANVRLPNEQDGETNPGVCMEICSGLTTAWADKCAWSDTCSGCTACVPPSPPADATSFADDASDEPEVPEAKPLASEEQELSVSDPCGVGFRLERRTGGGDLCRQIDGSQNWKAPRGCEKVPTEPFAVSVLTQDPCKIPAMPAQVYPAAGPCNELSTNWADMCSWTDTCSGCSKCQGISPVTRNQQAERRPTVLQRPTVGRPCKTGFRLEQGNASSGDRCRAMDGSGVWDAPIGCKRSLDGGQTEPYTINAFSGANTRADDPCQVVWTLGQGTHSIASKEDTEPLADTCVPKCAEYTPPWAEKCTWAPDCSGCEQCSVLSSLLDRTDFEKDKIFKHDWKQLVGEPQKCGDDDLACHDANLERLVDAYFKKRAEKKYVTKEHVDAMLEHRGQHCSVVQVINNQVLYRKPPDDRVYAETTWRNYQTAWPHLAMMQLAEGNATTGSLLASDQEKMADDDPSHFFRRLWVSGGMERDAPAPRKAVNPRQWGPQAKDALYWPWANHRLDDVACLLRRATELGDLPDVEMVVCPDDSYQHGGPLMSTDSESAWLSARDSVEHIPVLTANAAPENWAEAIPVPMPGRGAPNPRESYNMYRSPSYASSHFAQKTLVNDSTCTQPAWDTRASKAIFRGAVYEKFCREYEAEKFVRGPIERTPCARIALISRLAEDDNSILDVRASASMERETRMHLDPLSECKWEANKLLLVLGNFQGYADRVAGSLTKSSASMLVDSGAFEWFYPLMIEDYHYFRADPTVASIRRAARRALNGTADLRLMAKRANALAKNLFPLDRAAHYMASIARRYQASAANYTPTMRDGFSQPMCGGDALGAAEAPRSAESAAAATAGTPASTGAEDSATASKRTEAAAAVPSPAPEQQQAGKSAYKHAVPAGVQCKAVIFAAGMPRAGSTLQFKVIKQALHDLGQVHRSSGMWNMPKHTHLSPELAAEAYALEDQKWLHNTTADDVLLYKVHEFDEDALALCQTRIVLTVRRNLFDEYKSAVTAFNMTTGVSVAHAAGSVKLWAAAFAAWKQQPDALVLDYEDMVADIDATYATVLKYLARRLGKEAEIPTPLPSAAGLVDMEANPNIPSSGRKASQKIVEACRKALEGARDYLTDTPEDPTRWNLKWGLEENGQEAVY